MNPWRGLKALPHNMWLLFGAALINRSGTMVLPFFALYLTQKMGFTESDAGFVLACYGIGALVTAPFVGKLSDYIGPLRVMKYSLISTGLLMFAYPFFTSYTLIIIITLVFSVISEAFRPASLALIVDVVTTEQRKTAFALNRLAINLGMSVGPVIGGFLTLLDYSIIFYANGVTSLSAGAFLILSKWDEMPKERTAPDHLIEKKQFEVLRDARLIFFVVGMLPVCMIFFQHISTMPLFIVEFLGYSAAAFGLFSAINTVMIIFIEVPLNNAMGKWSDRHSLALGSLLTGIGFGAMAFAHSTLGIALTIAIWTFGEMIFFPSSANYVAEIAPPEKRGEYMGFYQMSFSIAFTIGPWIGLRVYEYSGPFILWIGTFIMSLVSVLIFLRLRKPAISGV